MNRQDAVSVLEDYICGCGLPSAALERMHELLGESDEKDTVIHMDRNAPADVWLIFYLLDSLGIIEHGTAITYSWLTEKGAAIVKALNIAKNYGYDYSLMTEEE